MFLAMVNVFRPPTIFEEDQSQNLPPCEKLALALTEQIMSFGDGQIRPFPFNGTMGEGFPKLKTSTSNQTKSTVS